MIKRLRVIQLVLSFISVAGAAVPTLWNPAGIGGGGALFSPSINPANDNEYYVGCDMSELFHTTDFGDSYSLLPFGQIQGGHNSSVQFTNNTQLRYCITYADDEELPVKSTDGGVTWTVLSGNPDATEETYGIFADYNNPNRVIISYYGSINFSSDSGTHFTQIHTAANSGNGVIVGGVFYDGNNIYIGTSDGLLVSTNGGTTFSISSVTGIPTTEAIFSFAGAKQGGITRFFCTTGAAASMYVGLVGSDYYGFLQGVYSLDYGTGTWTKKMNGIQVGTDNLMYVAMAGNDITTAYMAGITARPVLRCCQNKQCRNSVGAGF